MDEKQKGAWERLAAMFIAMPFLVLMVVAFYYWAGQLIWAVGSVAWDIIQWSLR